MHGHLEDDVDQERYPSKPQGLRVKGVHSEASFKSRECTGRVPHRDSSRKPKALVRKHGHQVSGAAFSTPPALPLQLSEGATDSLVVKIN